MAGMALPTSVDPKNWLTRKQLARYLAEHGVPISIRTLERWAANSNQGKGPPFTAMRWNFVRYLKADADAWIATEVRRVQ